MLIGSMIQIYPFNFKPSAPPAGSYIFYAKTDNVLYMQDSSGTEYPFASADLITSLTGDVTGTGPGAAATTIQKIQGNTVSGTTGTVNVVFSDSPTLTGTITAAAANFSGAITASNFSGASSGTNTGDITLTAVGSSPNANAASLSGQALTLQPADNTHPGVLTAIAQTIGGAKSFTAAMSVAPGSVGSPGLYLSTDNTTGLYRPAVDQLNITVAGAKVANFGTSGLAITGLVSASHFDTASLNPASSGIIRLANLDAIEWRNAGNTADLGLYLDAGDVFQLGSALTVTGNINASNFSGSTTGTNTGDVTLTNTNSINLAFTSGQTGLNATLNLSAAAADAGNVKATYSIKTDGLFIEFPYGTPVNIGTSNVPGSASSFALSDHVHAITSSVIMGLLLTGYVVGTNTPLTASNSILTAFENLQGQINATNTAAVTSLTGDVTGTGPGATATTIAKIQGTTVSGTTGSGNVVFSASPTFTGTITAAAISASSLTDTSLTPGSVVFVGAGGLLTQDNSKFYWDDTNAALGVGTIPGVTAVLDVVNSSGSTKAIQATGYGSNVGFRGRYANGTLGSPTAATTGNIISFASGRGYGSTGFAAAATGVINIVAAATFTDTSMPTYISFSTTPTASVTSTERLRINSTGNVLIGTITDNATDLLQVNAGLISAYSKLAGATSGYVQHQAAAITTTYTLTWPAAQGAAGNYLYNVDGAGTLGWTNPLVNIDGGTANSNYTSGQFINGGTP